MITQLKEHGSVTRGWIGVQIQPVTQDIADSLGLKKAEGALVAQPQDGSPAVKAGIEAGDVITAVNGQPVKDARDLAKKIGSLQPKTTVKIAVLHKGAEKSFDISADLDELARTPVIVVSAGPKAILDIEKTLEVLETRGVPVVAYGADIVPAFSSRLSPYPAPLRLDRPEAIAGFFRTKWALGIATDEKR